MKTLLKDSIWIEGFDTIDTRNERLRVISICDTNIDELIYSGKTSEISEELAKECVKFKGTTPWFKNYDNTHNLGNLPDGWHELKSAKESIQSACSQEYCIIYKTK